MKLKLIALTFVVLLLSGCSYSDFNNCMDFCVEQIDGRCVYNRDFPEISRCNESVKTEVEMNCFEICNDGDLDGGENENRE